MPTLLYDGTCRFCVAQARRLKRLAGAHVQAESMYADGVRDRFPMLPLPGPDGKIGEIKFVDDRGRMSGGAEAIARALITGPLGWGARFVLHSWSAPALERHLPRHRQTQIQIIGDLRRLPHLVGGQEFPSS